LIISHQEKILDIADKIVVVAGGQVVNCGKKDDVLPDLLSRSKPNFSCVKL
jgi:Fe-S cluster assembly ATP-binding protein